MAIGGETWLASEQGLRKITFRGWVAVACLVLAFSLGVVKEQRTITSSKAAVEKQAELETKLDQANKSLDNMEASNRRLEESNRHLEGLVSHLGKEIDRVPKVVDRGVLKRGERLRLYANDLFEYHILGGRASIGFPPSPRMPSVVLYVESRSYPLRNRDGSVRIYGRVVKPMAAEIRGLPSDWMIKYNVKSSEPWRERGDESSRVAK